MTLLPVVRSVHFGPIKVDFDERVLAPRPWTIAQSHWATEVAAWAPPGRVLEMCCGAGHIGLAAAFLSGRDLVQIDIDEVACSFAERNAARAGLAQEVEVRCAPVARAVTPDETFPIIVADPPYVQAEHLGQYPEDPSLAIDGGVDGLKLVKECVVVAAENLAPGGLFILQVRDDQQVAAAERFGAAAGLSVSGSRTYRDAGCLVGLHHSSKDEMAALVADSEM